MPNVRNDQYVNSGPGAVGPEQAAIESVVTGSMPTANRISVTKNPDGTIQTHVSITDATPIYNFLILSRILSTSIDDILVMGVDCNICGSRS